MQLVWMGDSLGDVAHVERGEGRWLRDCAVELVLALLDDGLEVFEDVEVAFPRGQGLVELLLLLRGDVVLVGQGEGGGGEGGREKRFWPSVNMVERGRGRPPSLADRVETQRMDGY